MNEITKYKELINRLPPEVQTLVVNSLEFGQAEPRIVKENGFKKFDIRPEKPEFVPKALQKEDVLALHYTELLDLAKKRGRSIRPICRKRLDPLRTGVTNCRKCMAPQEYLRNHGYYTRKSSGDKFPKHTCKVCQGEYAPGSKRKPVKHICPYCGYAMDPKRKYSSFTVYYCKQKDCSHRNLHPQKKVYCEREWHLDYDEIDTIAEFKKAKHKGKLKMNMKLLDLEMLLFVELGASVNETAKAISRILGTNTRLTSRQTVLNHAKKLAAYLLEHERLFPTKLSDTVVEDETYLRYSGKWGYLFRAINPESRNIICEYFSRNRDSLSCIKLNKLVTEKYLGNLMDPEFRLISDQAPIYTSMIDYMEQKEKANIEHITIKGIFDEPNEINSGYRPKKQMIERSFGTLKSFTKRRRGFTSFCGVEVFTTLHRFFYNHLRTHEHLQQVPVPIYLKNGSQITNWGSMIQFVNEKLSS
jgi:transposase-like protein